MLATVRRMRHALGAALRASELRGGATPHQVVWRRGPACLRYYAPRVEAAATPLLLVMPIINRYRVADLEPESSLAGSLRQAGIPVYVMDWGAPRRLDGGTDFEDYVLRLLPAALRAVNHPGPVDLLGYCLGGTLAVLFSARFPERVRRLVTLNAPVDFSCDRPHMDLLVRWVQREHFPVEALTRAFGNMPAELIQQGFLWQRPLASALKLPRAWRRWDDRRSAERFWVLESWNQDGVDVPGAAYRRLIGDLYRDNRLARGAFRLGGQRVDLQRIRCPLLVVTASSDVICPPQAAQALVALVGSQETRVLQLPGGHISSVTGRRAPATLHGPLAEWLNA